MVSDAFWVLTGAPGAGKTAVLDQLRDTLRCVDEPARRVLAEQRAIDGDGTPERNPDLFVEHLLKMAIADHEAARDAGRPTMFDRGMPDCIAYATYLGVDPGPSLSASMRYRYLDIFLLEPWEQIYTTDGERTMSFDETVAFHAALENAYDLCGSRPVTVPRGSPAERAAFVRDRIP